MAVSSPNSVAFKFSVLLIGMPMTAKIIQTIKQTVNASVLTMSTDRALRLLYMVVESAQDGRCESGRERALG